MVDFSKLGPNAFGSESKTLLETFVRLDRQVSHVELRPSQVGILSALDQRISERDVVVKLPTGGGKTTIGLVYLKHQMDKKRQPAVYLVPTVQLVGQVIDEGRKIGLSVTHWGRGESHPPAEVFECKAILVCTYDKFFNGRSTFARHDVRLIPGAIVFDDVHAGIESVRKCFSAEISQSAHQEVLTILAADLESYDPVNYSAIYRQFDPSAVVEVPFWIFSNHCDAILGVLEKYSSDEALLFAWPYISKSHELLRVVISSDRTQVSLDPPAVELVPHHRNAAHRLFMSASVHDGSVLIRELDCDAVAAANPVEAPDGGSVGERLVLVPSLVDTDFSREELFSLAKSVRSQANVVVLVPSFAAAQPWANEGASIVDGDSITEAIAHLKATKAGQFFVFAQRYDGVDLPDHACRLLIVDGLPTGDSLADRADQQAGGGVVGVRAKTANRIEQGLGRAVRSASDYCVVVLAGRELANFVSRSNVLENFSPGTVRQIEIGKVVSRAIAQGKDRVSAAYETIMQCLNRDESWKNFYLQSMSVQSDASAKSLSAATIKRDIATRERAALAAALRNDVVTAYGVTQKAADTANKDIVVRGILKQTAAKYQYLYDRAAALQLQASAYQDNMYLSRPPTLLPRATRRITEQAGAIVAWLESFEDKHGALLELDDLRSRLAFANKASDVEDAVRDLGRVIGADASRPEKEFNRGPDVLWDFGETVFVIELKSDKLAPLSKSDAGQLSLSTDWARERAQEGAIVVSVAVTNNPAADVVGDYSFGAHVWGESDLIDILDRFRLMVVSLIAQGPIFMTEAANIQGRLPTADLTPKQLKSSLKSITQK